jgi:hypoxanthine phosphoribosyltransferase
MISNYINFKILEHNYTTLEHNYTTLEHNYTTIIYHINKKISIKYLLIGYLNDKMDRIIIQWRFWRMAKKDWEYGIRKVLISEEELQTRIKELGRQITEDFKDKEEDLIVVCLLKGSVLFFSDLCKEIKLPLKMDFMTVSSYGNEFESSREVKIVKDLDENIMGKNVLVVEDIIDSGLTLKRVLKILGHREPKSVHLCTLLNKEVRREAEVDVQYIGFNIEDEFVLGYGLDFKQEYRNIPYVGVMGPLDDN